MKFLCIFTTEDGQVTGVRSYDKDADELYKKLEEYNAKCIGTKATVYQDDLLASVGDYIMEKEKKLSAEVSKNSESVIRRMLENLQDDIDDMQENINSYYEYIDD